MEVHHDPDVCRDDAAGPNAGQHARYLLPAALRVRFQHAQAAVHLPGRLGHAGAVRLSRLSACLGRTAREDALRTGLEAYSPADCTLGVSIYLGAAGVLLTFLSTVLSRKAEAAYYSSKAQRRVIDGQVLVCVM